jgi:hypothetical protein
MNIVATNTDPILFLPPLRKSIDVFEIAFDAPADTSMELFVITKSKGYTEQPYRRKVTKGPNEVSIRVEEKDINMLRLDPGAVAGAYSINRITLRSDCR